MSEVEPKNDRLESSNEKETHPSLPTVEAGRPRPSKAARNERRKAFATMLNAVSVAILVTALLQPLIVGSFSIARIAFALGGFVALQLAVYYLLGRLED